MSWDEILGHEDAKRLLRWHVIAGRVANAYLIAGPDGIGKRRLALEMAKTINCTRGPSERPCDACPTCSQIRRGVHPDVHVLLPGGPSDRIRIDDVRHVLGRAALRPFNAAMQVVILDGAERITEEAANSVLKMLEEPPRHTRFFLTTARLAFCLPTIVSRCQVIRCGPLGLAALAEILVANGTEASVAQAVAPLCGGSASRALSLVERWSGYQQVMARVAGDSPEAWVEHPLPETREAVTELIDGLIGWLRDLAVAAVDETAPVNHVEYVAELRHQAATLDVDRCADLACELATLRESLEQFGNPRLIATLVRERWLSLASAR